MTFEAENKMHGQKLAMPFGAEVFGHQADQTIELVELGGGEAFEGHFLDVMGGCGNHIAQSAAARGQLDEALSAMVGIRRALYYSVAFHAAQRDCHGRLLDTDQTRQLGLGGFLEMHEPGDDGIGAGQDAVLRRTLGKAPDDAAT